MKVGTGVNLGLSREYHKKLFGPLLYTWWNCPLTNSNLSRAVLHCNLFMGVTNSSYKYLGV